MSDDSKQNHPDNNETLPEDLDGSSVGNSSSQDQDQDEENSSTIVDGGDFGSQDAGGETIVEQDFESVEPDAGQQTVVEDLGERTIQLEDEETPTLQEEEFSHAAKGEKTVVDYGPSSTIEMDAEGSDESVEDVSTADAEQATLDLNQTIQEPIDSQSNRTILTDSNDGLDFDLEKTWGIGIQEATDPGMTIRGDKESIESHSQDEILPKRELSATDPQAEYQLIKILGEGGMGVVWESKQRSIDRNVAIKMIKSTVAEKPLQLEKFVAEAVVTGDLAHPNIVPIHDLGQDENGNYFYAMKQVQGTPWNKVIRTRSMQENLDTLLRTCDAIAFSHARGIVHRDLKPENIMLGDFGEVLVMDWGLAFPTAEFKKRESICQVHGMGGTPAYMAPEMATGPLDTISYASDIYLLGAILYEIVNGYPPHRGGTTQQCLVAAMKNYIEPAKIEHELNAIATKALHTSPDKRYGSVKAFQSAIRNYLDHEKSLKLTERAKEQLKDGQETKDYEHFSRSLFGFEEALLLWPENDEAIKGLSEARAAYATTAFEKEDFDLAESLIGTEDEELAPLLVRIQDAKQDRIRRQMLLGVAKKAVVALALAIFIIVGASYYLINEEYKRAVAAEKEASFQEKVAVQEAEEAKRQRVIAESEKDRADKNLAVAVVARMDAEQAQKKAEQEEQEATRQKEIAIKERAIAEAARQAEQYKSYVASIGLAAAKVEENAFSDALHLLETCPPQYRHWEWGRLMYLCSQSEIRYPCDAPVDGLALSPDGKQFATASWDGKLRIWEMESQNLVKMIDHEGIYVHAVDWSPKSNTIVTGSNDSNGNLKFWDSQTGELQKAVQAHNDAVIGVRYSNDGKWLMSCSYDETAAIWNVEGEPRELCRLQGHTWWVWDGAFEPGFDPFSKTNNRVVTVGQDGKAIVWAIFAEEGQSTQLIDYVAHDGPVYSVDYHPTESLVATGGYDRTIQLWNPSDIEPFDFTAAIRGELATDQEHATLTEHNGPIRSVRFSKTGELLVSGSQDNSVKVWNVASTEPIKTFRGHDSAVRACQLTDDGRSILSCSEDHQTIRWSVDDYAEIQTLDGQELAGHRDAILSARFSPIEGQVLTTSRDRSAYLWNISTGEPAGQFREGHEYLSSSALFVNEERILITSAADNSVRIWNASSGSELARIDQTGRSGLLAVSADEKYLATGSEGNGIQIWKLPDFNQESIPHVIKKLNNHSQPITAICFIPGDRVVTGDVSGRMILQEIESGKVIWTRRDHTLTISDIAVAGSEPLILAASHDKTIGVHSLETGEELLDRVLKREGPVLSLSVSLDGNQVIASSLAPEAEKLNSTTLTVWDFTDGSIQFEKTLSGVAANDFMISPDGEVGYTTCNDNTVKRIDLQSGELEDLLDGINHGGLLWTSVLSRDGRRLLTVGGIDARLWDLRTGRERMSFGPHGAVASAAIDPTGKILVTGSWDRSLKIWDVTTGKSVKRISDAHQGYINSVTFSADGTKLVSGADDGMVQIWDAKTMEPLRLIRVSDSAVQVTEFSPDGKTILTASRDRSLRLFEVSTGKQIREFEQQHQWSILAARFSPDGMRVVSGSEDNQAIIWDVTTGQPIAELNGHTAAVTSVSFSADGKRVLTASRDNSAKLWDVTRGNEGNEILTLKSHKQEVTAVDFSQSMLNVLTGSRDGTAIVWPAINWMEMNPEDVASAAAVE